MKNNFHIEDPTKVFLTLLLLGMICTGCLESYYQVEIYMDVTPVTLDDFPSGGGNKTLTIKSNTKWNVRSSESWLTVSNSEGHDDRDVTLHAEENKGFSPLTATITISGKGFTDITRTVRIAGVTQNLSVTPQELRFAGGGSSLTKELTIEATGNWELTRSQNWIRVYQGGDTGEHTVKEGTGNQTLKVTVSPNPTYEERKATITIKNANEQNGITIDVVQEAYPYRISVSPAFLEFEASGGQKQITISGNLFEWSLAPDSDTSYFTISPVIGLINEPATVTAPPNLSVEARTITFYFESYQYYENEAPIVIKSENVTVTQKGVEPILELPQTPLYFPDTGGSETFSITSNTNWNVESNYSWLHVSKESGSMDDQITVIVDPNTGAIERTATIDVSCEGIRKTILVIQYGASPSTNLAVSTYSLHFTYREGQATFEITSNTQWNVSCDAPWVSLSDLSGSNNRTITVSVPSNDYSMGIPALHALITISSTSGGQTLYVIVTQQGAGALSGNNWQLITNALRANLLGTGVLYFTPTGQVAMYDYTSSARPRYYTDTRTAIVWVEMGDGVTSVGNYAFADLPNLISATLPHSITAIGASSFRNCAKLLIMRIPSSVTAIGNNAFDSCTALKEVYVDWVDPLRVNQNVFAGITLSSVRLHVPRGTSARYLAADVWKSFGTIVEY